MKEENNITQLYQDAFKDFAVEAPASTYAKVQNQLGRKSLLTLDPTRLNVFYLALVSGIVAWAIIGNSPAPIADQPVNEEKEVASVILGEEANDLQESIVYEEVETEKMETLALQEETSRTCVNRSTVSGNSAMTEHETVDSESIAVVLPEETITTEMEAPTSLELNEESELEDNKALDVIEVAEEMQKQEDDRPTTSVNGAKVESAEDFLRGLKFDRDNNAGITVRKKSKK